MIYLNSAPAHQEAMFRAAAEAGVRYLRMDFAIGAVYQFTRGPEEAILRIALK